MTLKSLFNQVGKASTQYHAEFKLDKHEYAILQDIRTLTVDQKLAIAAINSGNGTRKDCSTVINAIHMYKGIIAPNGKIKSSCAASL